MTDHNRLARLTCSKQLLRKCQAYDSVTSVAVHVNALNTWALGLHQWFWPPVTDEYWCVWQFNVWNIFTKTIIKFSWALSWLSTRSLKAIDVLCCTRRSWCATIFLSLNWPQVFDFPQQVSSSLHPETHKFAGTIAFWKVQTFFYQNRIFTKTIIKFTVKIYCNVNKCVLCLYKSYLNK